MKFILLYLMIFFMDFSNASAQSKDSLPIKDTSKSPTIETLKNWELSFGKPIKDSNEYKIERKVLIELWKTVVEKRKKNNQLLEEIDMLSGPVNFYNRIEKNGGKATEKDKKYAKAGIAIIDKRDWMPEVKLLASKARQILIYIECCL